MTVSGDTTFDLGRDSIINDALSNVGALGPGKSASGVMRDHAAQALNRVVKALDAEGKFLWRVTRRSLTLTDGTASYDLTASNTDVIEVDGPLNYRTSNSATNRTPIEPMSRDDYMRITDRTIEGIPQRYFVEYTLPRTVNIIFWPTPDTTSAIVEYSAVLRSDDYDDGDDTGSYPARWLNCLVYGLTAELAPAYKQPQLMATFRKLFLEERDRQMNAGDEKGPTIFVPFGGLY